MAARFVRTASSVLAPSFCKIFRKTTALSARLPAQINGVRKQCMQQRAMSSAKPLMQKETVTIHFQTSEGEHASVQAKVGDNLLDVIIENNVDIDGFGACEGTLACSTCHLIFKQEHFDQIPDKPTDEELDMLDLAYSLTDTSRLGCQVIVTKDMEGWEVHVPAGVSDAREL